MLSLDSGKRYVQISHSLKLLHQSPARYLISPALFEMESSYDTTNYGKRFLPCIIDQRAESGYAKPYAIFPRSEDPSEGFRSVSYVQLANAVNRLCWWMNSDASHMDGKGSTFAYMGPNDLRYLIFVLAAMKTGRKVSGMPQQINIKLINSRYS
jgi:acyl-coenzyme A synthetase/AMP-(fatty) acid ligase